MASIKRQFLQLLQRQLRGELRRSRRRKSSAPLWIAVLTVSVFGVGQLVHEPKAPLPPRGAELLCTVREVYDGDTVAAGCEQGRLKVRLFGIDAPEIGQAPWGDQSRRMLRQLLPPTSTNLRFKVTDIDRYGRVVAQLYHQDQDLGLNLVHQGGAVVYTRYNDSSRYRSAQTQAKRARRGVWSEPGAQQTPWEWRKYNPR